jgi:ubiquinone/menaquinone biosynthesis C-methylase UbiE
MYLKQGDKVLDMGCGTGEVTAFLAEMVGKQTEVVGVDPDIDRIKFAVQQHSGNHKNITFVHGDSSTTFLHFNEQ